MSLGSLSNLFARLERLARDKHSSLLRKSVNEGQFKNLVTADESDGFQDSVEEALPEDVGHEAVDEEVGGGVDDHRELRKVAQQQNPHRQVVAVVVQSRLEILNGENLKLNWNLN